MNNKTRSFNSFICFAVLILATLAAHAAEEDGQFVPLFNGHDLSGWVPINVAPGTFSVRDGIIVSTGFPTGLLRTERQYENFIVELEWRHMKPGGNAGFFVWGDGLAAPGSPFARGMEVQILDNGYPSKGKNEWYTTHGDVFPVHGSTMTPTGRISSTGKRSFPIEDRSKSSPQWNHYRVEGRDGVLRLSVNGKEVTVGRDCSPRKGYLCLESEGSECQFRNIRIRELPSSNPNADEIADPAEGFVPLYTGVDLSGWKADPGHRGHWQPKDWILAYDGKSEAKDKNLWTQKEYGDFVLICDWRWTRKPKLAEVPTAGNGRFSLSWPWAIGSGEAYGYRNGQSMSAEVRAGVALKKKAQAPIGKWNRFIGTLRGGRLTVNLNGDTVIDALLPPIRSRGPIALQHHDDPIEYANIYIKELD